MLFRSNDTATTEIYTAVNTLSLHDALTISAFIATLLLVYVYRRLQRLDVPENAGFFATLRLVPLALVVGLDLLDLGLDVFSAPIVWYLLRRLRLGALRNVATFEALIPFTGPIPTLTIAWFAARWFNLSDER